MKFSYKFNNLLGTVYHQGNLVFTHDGYTLISPVGNRLTCFNLKNEKTETLPVESVYNYTTVGLSPDGSLLVTANEIGEISLISVNSKTVLHRKQTGAPIHAIAFSPDLKHFAFTKENSVFVYSCPGPQTRQYNPFNLEKVFTGSYDETTSIAWSTDSRVIAVGSKDMSVKVYPFQPMENMGPCVLGSHNDHIVGCFFVKSSLDLYTVSRNGQVCVWESNLNLEQLEPAKVKKKKQKQEDDDALPNEMDNVEEVTDKEGEANKKMYYKRQARLYLSDHHEGDKKDFCVSSVCYHCDSRLLVAGLSHGAFYILEMPDGSLIQSLSMSNHAISSVAVNCSGEWLALGSGALGQLVVYEWQSETHVLKQQGHANNFACVSYSPDGHYLATGGDDGKVKVWRTDTGFCFVTFTEHTAGVTGVVFTQSGKAVLSASLDGSVRAFDMMRYRNFRTLTSPTPAQFGSLGVDPSGELVCAGSVDTFLIYLWSMKTGRLLEILSGHEGPVPGVSFSPAPQQSLMASCSWDKTLRIWDPLSSTAPKDTITLQADGTCCCFSPDGGQVAVGALDGSITFFSTETALQVGSIEGRSDLGSGRSDVDMITAKKNLEGKAFNTLCYSPDGLYILAAGQSKNICIYNVPQELLVKKFEITQNRSLDAMDEFVFSRRKMTEWGNLNLMEERDDGRKVSISLPGVKKGDMAARAHKPEVRVSQLCFSPAGRSFCACTTEGLLIYSLDHTLVFSPFLLEEDVTPTNTRRALHSGDYSMALILALKMGEHSLLEQVLETIPYNSVNNILVELVSRSLSPEFVDRLLAFLCRQLDRSRHLEFYARWIQEIFLHHAQRLREQYKNRKPTLTEIQRVVTRKTDNLRKVCEYNKYTLDYLDRIGDLHQLKRRAEET